MWKLRRSSPRHPRVICHVSPHDVPAPTLNARECIDAAYIHLYLFVSDLGPIRIVCTKKARDDERDGPKPALIYIYRCTNAHVQLFSYSIHLCGRSAKKKCKGDTPWKRKTNFHGKGTALSQRVTADFIPLFGIG